jgi:hypothetical protein
MEISLKIEMPALAHLPDFYLPSALIAAGSPWGPLVAHGNLAPDLRIVGRRSLRRPPERTALRISRSRPVTSSRDTPTPCRLSATCSQAELFSLR